MLLHPAVGRRYAVREAFYALYNHNTIMAEAKCCHAHKLEMILVWRQKKKNNFGILQLVHL